MNSKEIENGVMQIYLNDKKLAPVIDASGKCLLQPRKDHYYSLLRAIIGQQLSTIVARVIVKRFFEFYNGKPEPASIINTPVETLRNLGVSYAKIKYVKDLSEKVISGVVHFRGLNKKSDNEIILELTQVNGIGTWTAHMFLMFTLGRLNILPVGDLGIRRAAMKLYGLRKIPDEKKIILLSKKNGWEPYNSIASWYLWQSIDMKLIR